MWFARRLENENMKRLMVAMVAVGLLAGCGDEAAKTAATAAPAGRTYVELAESDVLVSVNGKSLTKADVESEMDLQRALILTVNPRQKLERIELKLGKVRGSAPERFVNRTILLDEAERRGITASEELRADIRKRFMAQNFKFSGGDFESLKKKMSLKFYSRLEADLDADARLEALRAAMTGECRYEATEKEAETRAAAMRQYNERMAKVQAGIYRDATNAWNRVQAGESMEAAVERIVASGNKHAEADMDWGTFELSFFDEFPQVGRFLSVMPVGTVSPPVEGDNGLMIFKLLDVVNPDQASGHVRYHLARIFFELPEFYPELAGEALRKRISEERTERAVKERVAALVKAAHIAYPNGTAKQLFARPSKAANSPVSQKQKGK